MRVMPKAVAGPEIERLIQLLARLPGLGPRSARRAALHLIKKREQLMTPLTDALEVAQSKIVICSVCGNIDTQNPCTVCTDPKRDQSLIIAVADVADLWALERAAALNARYHVLGGTLSPLDGVGPDELPLADLSRRVREESITEVILATPPSVDGEATALLLARELGAQGVRISRIASGVPHGGDLEFADQVTLGRAIDGRRSMG